MQVPLPHGCFSHSSTSGRRGGVNRTGGGGDGGGDGGGWERILTDTHGLLPRRLEAVGAVTAEAAQRVDALTRVADARVLVALVTV